MKLCSVWATEFALVFQTNKCVTVTDLDFVLGDRRQKTFGFLNRLCLLISNPLPPSVINRQPWFFMIQRPYFILILVLVAHTYTIYTCINTVYIPILYLFYTCILYFFTLLHFNKKYIWFNLLFYTRFVFILWQWTF